MCFEFFIKGEIVNFSSNLCSIGVSTWSIKQILNNVNSVLLEIIPITSMKKKMETEDDDLDKRNDDWWRLEKFQIGRRRFC